MAWTPPPDWTRITTIDCHAAGEPLRVITGGFPPIPGDTILAKRRYAREHLDHLRRALIFEPRGHADMYGCIFTEPATPDGDLGVLFLHNQGYNTVWGAAFSAYCKAADLGVRVIPEDFRRLIDAGVAVKHAVMASLPIVHPFEPDMGFLYGTIIDGPPHAPDAHSRNVCIFADGEVDRSPTGTGVSGRIALEHAKGRLSIGEPFVVESLIGTRFAGRIVRTTTFGEHEAVIPEVEGSAWITGHNEFWIAPDDPLKDGFILR